jgi:hypothetical protein
MGTRVFKGPDNLLAQFLELAQNPLPEATGMFKAIVDAGLFFARGTGPHVNYSPQAAIDYLLAGEDNHVHHTVHHGCILV